MLEEGSNIGPPEVVDGFETGEETLVGDPLEVVLAYILGTE